MPMTRIPVSKKLEHHQLHSPSRQFGLDFHFADFDAISRPSPRRWRLYQQLPVSTTGYRMRIHQLFGSQTLSTLRLVLVMVISANLIIWRRKNFDKVKWLNTNQWVSAFITLYDTKPRLSFMLTSILDTNSIRVCVRVCVCFRLGASLTLIATPWIASLVSEMTVSVHRTPLLNQPTKFTISRPKRVARCKPTAFLSQQRWRRRLSTAAGAVLLSGLIDAAYSGDW